MVVTVEQACEMLGCKRRRLFELLADGTITRAERYGRGLRILRASVEAALLPKSNGRKRRARTAPAAGWDLSDVPLESQR